MPRYFFHSENGSPRIDREGTELVDLAAAKIEAIRHTGYVMANEPHVLEDGRDFLMELSDQAGTLLFTITCYAREAPLTNNRHSSNASKSIL